MKKLFILLSFLSLHATPLSHKVALKAVDFASPSKEIPFTGFYRMEKQCDQFFKDLGAISLSDGYGFKGYYISFESVKNNSAKTYGKWKETLKTPKNAKLLDLMEGNLASSNLNELFSFPRAVHYLKEAKNSTVLIFLDYKLPLAMQVRDILNFSLRGYNVLAVDFYHYTNGKYPVKWKTCKKVADLAYSSVSGNVIAYGKSFGAAAAAYLGSKHQLEGIILDRPFLSMDAVASSFVLKSFIKEHYDYPTSELIKRATTDPLIIVSGDNRTFQGHGEELLSTYIRYQKNKDHDTLMKNCFIPTKGGHYSSFLNEGMSSWFSYGDAQDKLNEYLYKSENFLFIP